QNPNGSLHGRWTRTERKCYKREQDNRDTYLPHPRILTGCLRAEDAQGRSKDPGDAANCFERPRAQGRTSSTPRNKTALPPCRIVRRGVHEDPTNQ
ncbi:MAG: hypothetical protein ACYTBV_18090, partial [Planctomycetota bacterium]